MQHLKSSGTPVLYVGRTVFKGQSFILHTFTRTLWQIPSILNHIGPYWILLTEGWRRTFHCIWNWRHALEVQHWPSAVCTVTHSAVP